MVELGQLERHHEEFTRRNVRVIAISMEGLRDAAKNQAEFPHLVVLADHNRGDRSLSETAELIHAHAAPDGSDADTPTTILVDRHGIVRWIYRSPRVIVRLSPNQVLEAIDHYLR